MQTEVAVFSNAGLWVDKADVVRASGDAVFAADAFGVLGMSILYRVKVPSLPASGKD